MEHHDFARQTPRSSLLLCGTQEKEKCDQGLDSEKYRTGGAQGLPMGFRQYCMKLNFCGCACEQLGLVPTS